jgi:DNA-binding CsgD family transcriptional regulator
MTAVLLVSETERGQAPAGLTKREVEVLGLLADGYLTKQVARALGISRYTVTDHIRHIYAKTGVSTRAGAAGFAIRHGLASTQHLR